MPKKYSGMQKIQFLNRISPQKINKPKIPFYFTVLPPPLGRRRLWMVPNWIWMSKKIGLKALD